jgi:glycosyltransferase involved in cell wall biosynthesis
MSDIDYFENLLPGRVFFVRHGVDTDFFHPVNHSHSEKITPETKSARFIFVGQWLRDQETLAGIIEKTASINPDIHFDLVVPEHSLTERLSSLASKLHVVSLYSDIPDKQLLSLYQGATGLLLPIKDCTANNALLEAVACGLPIIANDVGAVRNYTHNSFADLLQPGDVDGMVSVLLKNAIQDTEHLKRGIAARSFAKNNCNWHLAAQKTLDVYRTVLLK